MPTYEYRCPEGHEFERFQRMSDEPVAACPECGAQAERRISAGAGFLFKGSGFYITDYRSESWREGAKRDGADHATAASPGAPSPKESGSDAGASSAGKEAGSPTPGASEGKSPKGAGGSSGASGGAGGSGASGNSGSSGGSGSAAPSGD